MPTRNINYTDLWMNRPTNQPLTNQPRTDYTAYGTMTPQNQMMQDPSFGTDPFRGMGQVYGGQMGDQVMAPYDLNEQVVNAGGPTIREMRLAAEREELARLSELRERQRQGAAMQGSSMYEQAQMAMSQRQLMSDTRGLTGGAREFAQTGATAQEQMVLTQIKMGTAQQVLDIDAASLQDPRIAQEFGARAAELAAADDPRSIGIQTLQSQINQANAQGDFVTANRLLKQQLELVNSLYGESVDISAFTGALDENLERLINPEFQAELARYVREGETSDAIMGYGLAGLQMVGGATMTTSAVVGVASKLAAGMISWAGGISGAVTTATATGLSGALVPAATQVGTGTKIAGALAAGAKTLGVGAVAAAAAKVVIPAALVGIGIYLMYNGYQQWKNTNQVMVTGQASTTEATRLFAQERSRLRSQGLDDASIEEIMEFYKTDLAPKYQGL